MSSSAPEELFDLFSEACMSNIFCISSTKIGIVSTPSWSNCIEQTSASMSGPAAADAENPCASSPSGRVDSSGGGASSFKSSKNLSLLCLLGGFMLDPLLYSLSVRSE